MAVNLQEFSTQLRNVISRDRKGYADARVIEEVEERIIIKNGLVENVSIKEKKGFGIRILINGRWGFASSSHLTKGERDKIYRRAREIAYSSAAVSPPLKYVAFPPVVEDHYYTKFQIDPFSLPLIKKIDFLIKIDSILKGNDNKVNRRTSFRFKKIREVFFNNRGSIIHQEFLFSGGYIEVYVNDNDNVQKRTWGDMRQAGFEFIEELELLKNAERIKEEAWELTKAKPVSDGVKDIILDSSIIAYQVHNTVGNVLELDRILGTDIGTSGGSFIKPADIGKFKIGKEGLNIIADATYAQALGTFGYDDEGVKAHKFNLVEDGRVVNVMTSIDTAPLINLSSSNGSAKASSYDRIPTIRMTNVNIVPGKYSKDEIISDIKDGLYIDRIKSWSMDTDCLNFVVYGELAYRVKNGKIKEILRNPVFRGATPRFWGSVKRIGSESTSRLWGIVNRKKGDPDQIIFVGHRVPMASFENVQVGSFSF